ncbi:hypothetical protein DVH24_002329 [Malus domestica]|uniref:Uncharacterized protein n=1 Tax=Malus domestica TaxID=3750 RepID=A0A498IB62_MALDO|nr:hypothetical protein DVH24_002329 [Malus domestica]
MASSSKKYKSIRVSPCSILLMRSIVILNNCNIWWEPNNDIYADLPSSPDPYGIFFVLWRSHLQPFSYHFRFLTCLKSLNQWFKAELDIPSLECCTTTD